jgi:CBS-domain-containing membrane protein
MREQPFHSQQLTPVWRQTLRDLGCWHAPIGQIMRHRTACVEQSTSVETATRLLLEAGLPALPVRDVRGLVVGVISALDLLAEVQARGEVDEHVGRRSRARPGGAEGSQLLVRARATAQEVMTGAGASLNESSSVGHASALMAAEGLDVLPVNCSRCAGVCMVSALDIVRWLADQNQPASQSGLSMGD